MNTTINIIAASVFGVSISAGAVLYLGSNYKVVKVTPTPQSNVIDQRPVASAPTIQSNSKSAQLCTALSSMSRMGITTDRESYVMAVSGNDYNLLNATKNLCPQHF